ncbi:MAG: endonuclease MutS2 [Clostridia bacterium]
MISDKILLNLEYDKILKQLSKFLTLGASKEVLFAQKPQESFDDAAKSLDFTTEMDRVLYFYMRSPLENFDALNDILVRASKMSILSFSDLKKVSRLLRSARIFKDCINGINDPTLEQTNHLSSMLFEDKLFEEEIDETFISDDEIADRATPELFTIRKKIRKLNQDIKDKLAGLMRNKDIQKVLQDNIITSREGRFVLPLKAECKGQIPGLIHDYSASGSTIYVEPIEVVEVNNELRMLYVDETAEIERILERFTQKVSRYSRDLTMNLDLLIDADIVLSKARYGKSIKATRPQLLKDGSFDIVCGRHPLLQVEKIVPVSVKIEKNSCFILISGPNTGGKTVTLKMTGIFALMAMSGMYIPAKEGSSISFYSKIFSDIGDEQSIEQNLSTFSSHIVTLKYIVENVDSDSLVLLDEIGAGTDPQEGSALALAILEYLLEVNARGIITTHYSELKEFSYTTNKITNASMEFDMDTLAPTYKLNMGIPGSSKALEISRRLGLSETIIQNAKKKISPLKLSFDSVLSSAEKERVEASKLKEEYLVINQELQAELDKVRLEKERMFAERENITKLAKIEAKRIVADASSEAEDVLSEIKEIYNREEIGGREMIEASKLKNKLTNMSNATSVEDEEIEFSDFDIDTAKEGQNVYIKSLSSICQILSVNTKKKQITVQYGNMRFDAKQDNVSGVSDKYLKYYLNKTVPKTPKKIRNTTSTVQISGKVELDLNVVGKRVFEAVNEVNEFIDKSIMNGIETVKIIHGVGTGALKKAIAEELRSNKSVKTFRPGNYGEGEIGVTIVELKK